MIVLLFPQSICCTGIGWRVRGIGGGDGDHETAAAHWLVIQTMKGKEDLKEAMLRLCVCAWFAQLQPCNSGLNKCCSSILENLDSEEVFASQTRGYNRKRCNYQREQKANYFPWETVFFWRCLSSRQTPTPKSCVMRVRWGWRIYIGPEMCEMIHHDASRWLGSYMKLKLDRRGAAVLSARAGSDGKMWPHIMFRWRRHRSLTQSPSPESEWIPLSRSLPMNPTSIIASICPFCLMERASSPAANNMIFVYNLPAAI